MSNRVERCFATLAGHCMVSDGFRTAVRMVNACGTNWPSRRQDIHSLQKPCTGHMAEPGPTAPSSNQFPAILETFAQTSTYTTRVARNIRGQGRASRTPNSVQGLNNRPDSVVEGMSLQFLHVSSLLTPFLVVEILSWHGFALHKRERRALPNANPKFHCRHQAGSRGGMPCAFASGANARTDSVD